jgi:hypothetical protein
VSHPTDLYAFEDHAEGAYCRVIFHVIGKLLSGPNAWNEDSQLGKTLIYQTLREPPEFIGLVVVSSQQTFDARPKLNQANDSELLQVDFRLFVPTTHLA